MRNESLSRWRNLGIIAHIDAGKTTLTERLLWKSGAIHRVGEVHDGAATTDFDAIERERGITIGAAAVRIDCSRAHDEHYRLSLIDTPGHIDFAIEVERSLRVLDGAVAVFSAVDGVQPQSETVWRQASRHGLPMLAFVNKMDRPGADFDRVLGQLRERLGAHPLALGRPLGSESSFGGWIDFVDACTWTWDATGTARCVGWTADEAVRFAAERLRLVEAVAECDDRLADDYLEGRTIEAAHLRAALRRVTLAGRGVPVLAGSAIRHLGIDTLLDAIVDYLPSPLDRPAVVADSDDGRIELAPDPEAPLAALLFKVAHQAHGAVSYVRVYAGTIAVGDTLWCSAQGRSRRVGRLAAVQADRTLDIERAIAGEIVAILGWREAVSGETLSAPSRALRLDPIATQPAVLSWRLTAASSSDLVRLGQGLAVLAQEDPSFRVGVDADSGETLVWGMGELHLEVKLDRLRRDWNLDVRAGTPTVAYQETPLTEVAGVDVRLAKQNGGPGQYARVVIDVAPRSDGEVRFSDRSRGGAVPPAFAAATEKGIRAALAEGPHGYPVVGIDIALTDGDTHAQDSSELAFQRAGAEAIRQALLRSGTTVLEPVMRVEVDAPSSHVGDVIGDLNRRGGRVLSIDDQGVRAAIEALAPLAELASYTSALRSLTQGRAGSMMAFHRYEPRRGR